MGHLLMSLPEDKTTLGLPLASIYYWWWPDPKLALIFSGPALRGRYGRKAGYPHKTCTRRWGGWDFPTSCEDLFPKRKSVPTCGDTWELAWYPASGRWDGRQRSNWRNRISGVIIQRQSLNLLGTWQIRDRRRALWVQFDQPCWWRQWDNAALSTHPCDLENAVRPYQRLSFDFQQNSGGYFVTR